MELKIWRKPSLFLLGLVLQWDYYLGLLRQ